MLFIKFSFTFSILFLLKINFAFSLSSFSDMECLQGQFDTKVEHKSGPFGLFRNILTIKKKKCVLTIEDEKYKYIKNKWIIDICRSPIHVKIDSGSIEVIKRKGACTYGDKEGFCGLLSKIEGVIGDDGLIFAEGSKEDISTAHGKVYCASLLVGAHLRSGLIFDWTANYSNILKRKSYRERPKRESKIKTSESEGELIPADF